MQLFGPQQMYQLRKIQIALLYSIYKVIFYSKPGHYPPSPEKSSKN